MEQLFPFNHSSPIAKSAPKEKTSRDSIPAFATKCLDGIAFYFAGQLPTLSLELARDIVLAYGGIVLGSYKEIDPDTWYNRDRHRYANYAVLGAGVDPIVEEVKRAAGRYLCKTGWSQGPKILSEREFFDFVHSKLSDLPNSVMPRPPDQDLDEQDQDEIETEAVADHDENAEFLEGELYVNNTADDLFTCLTQIQYDGDWATLSRCSHPVNPGLQVSGLGTVGLPLSERDASALCAAAICASVRPCTFETLNPEFQNVIESVAGSALSGLGLPLNLARATMRSLQVESEGHSYSIPFTKE